jgi:small nuclear ribonucleoprotein (snRNP)-like protein
MSKVKTDSFILELPLVVQLADDRVMLGRLEAGRRLFNTILNEALTRLDLMRQSKEWQAARLMPKGKKDAVSKAKSAAFKLCNEHF